MAFNQGSAVGCIRMWNGAYYEYFAFVIAAESSFFNAMCIGAFDSLLMVSFNILLLPWRRLVDEEGLLTDNISVHVE